MRVCNLHTYLCSSGLRHFGYLRDLWACRGFSRIAGSRPRLHPRQPVSPLVATIAGFSSACRRYKAEGCHHAPYPRPALLLAEDRQRRVATFDPDLRGPQSVGWHRVGALGRVALAAQPRREGVPASVLVAWAPAFAQRERA